MARFKTHLRLALRMTVAHARLFLQSTAVKAAIGVGLANVGDTYASGGDWKRSIIINIIGVVSTLLIKGVQNQPAAVATVKGQ